MVEKPTKIYKTISVSQFMVGVDTSTTTATTNAYPYTIGKERLMCQCLSKSKSKMKRFGIEICKQCGRYLQSVVKTQKAKGILELGHDLPPTCSRNTHYVVKNLKNFECMPWDDTLARPCPVKPRPGFVDSRMVSCKEDLIAIQGEIKASGEDKGELLLARFLPAPHSGILTNTSITVGGGIDGATTGKDAFVFPLLEPVKVLKKRHIELLWMSYQNCYAVQSRAAPDVSVRRDHIAGPGLCIYGVISPDGSDLLAWEIKVNEAAGNYKKHVVAYLPGHPLTSHFCLHAIMAGINVVTSYQPIKGGYLASGEDDYYPLDYYHQKHIQKVILDKGYIDNASLMLAMAILHHWPAIDNSDIPERNTLFEFSVGYLIRAGIVACFGEMRHHLDKHKPSYCGCLNETCTYCFTPSGKKRVGFRPSRDEVYEKTGKTMEASIKKIPNYVDLFLDRDNWDGGSIGGPKWAEIMQQCAWCLKLVNNEVSITEVKKSWNILANLVHNNAKWITKFGSMSVPTMTMKAMPSFYKLMKGELYGY